ncbi:BIG/ATPase V1 complex, subunit S1 [Microdochium trichocladiopsis]|uniref:Protein BIG1 n=1 Tax=Microdochium trichocladiopsis TaxID=1682393 RepID=A0A9P8YBJ9_9PEZI|nr:BIG/ATPase V1 complex, subunit S1 [Microdochium trichocladiopsis]KAH7033314.1 BIG/ATPase V1 complex, subunit S1 [Microdochium trichocladiopsis]
MRFSVTAALAACCASAQAFSDSTPFILFSTAKFTAPDSTRQLQSSDEVVFSAKNILSSCPTDRYLLVTQPNLNAGHLRNAEAVPKLYSSLQKSKSSFSIAEVAGTVDVKQLYDYINKACDGKPVLVDEVHLTALSSINSATLGENDKNFGMVIDQYDMAGDYTVLYTAGSRTEEPQGYTPEFTDSMRTELKRQVQHPARKLNSTFENLPLFEKYQFFTPGIFMAFFVILILGSILFVGVSAVASLKVPYGAFDKDMGPSAQKKQ